MSSFNGVHQHDKFFRAALGYQTVAQEFFRVLLPSDVVRGMNFSSLKLEPKNYISDDLQEVYSDVVFSCHVPEQSADVLFLIEHQSSADRWMALRALHYLSSLLISYQKRTAVSLLPAVHTLLVCHGCPSSYFCSLDIKECVYDPLRVMSNLQFKLMNVVDLNTLSDDELGQWPWFGPVALALKYGRSDDLVEHVAGILLMLDRLVECENGVKFERLVVEYLVQAGNISDTKRFIDIVKQRVPERVGGVVMTVAEYFEQQGMEKGEKRGEKKGEKRGEKKGEKKARRQVALSMIKEGSDLAFVEKVTGLTRSELDDLQHGEKEGKVLN